MTAEIVIMNKEAIAMAADSAVTGRPIQKIFTSANKIFNLVKYNSIGIMIYGNASFMDVPWELIINIYRSQSKKRFGSLNDCANDFIKFLDNGNDLFPELVQNDYFKLCVNGYFTFLKGKIEEEIRKYFDENNKIVKSKIIDIINNNINEHYKSWNDAKNIKSIPNSFNEELLKKQKLAIKKIIKDVFEELPIENKMLRKLYAIASFLFSRYPTAISKEDISGIVIAGFGENDVFPSCFAYHLEGIVNNKLKYKEYASSKIKFGRTASIIPFAQRDMADTFIQGVDPAYVDIEKGYLKEIFNDFSDYIVEKVIKGEKDKQRIIKKELKKLSEKIVKDYLEKLDNYRIDEHVNPIISVVSMLPKDELASMAESLVSITSFKRKVGKGSETVGGPIDVAIISKGNGFIWVKRKHYFKSELNPHFIANINKEVRDDNNSKK